MVAREIRLPLNSHALKIPCDTVTATEVKLRFPLIYPHPLKIPCDAVTATEVKIPLPFENSL